MPTGASDPWVDLQRKTQVVQKQKHTETGRGVHKNKSDPAESGQAPTVPRMCRNIRQYVRNCKVRINVHSKIMSSVLEKNEKSEQSYFDRMFIAMKERRLRAEIPMLIRITWGVFRTTKAQFIQYSWPFDHSIRISVPGPSVFATCIQC